jgi:hypothetical protein
MPQQKPSEGSPLLGPKSPPVTSESSHARVPSGRHGTKRASTACNECRRRKIRCDIGSPCGNCIAHAVECVYDTLTDKRRRVAARLAEQESRYYREVLTQLLHTIRTEDEDRVQELIRFIRGGASEDDIVNILAQDTENRVFEAPEDFTLL